MFKNGVKTVVLLAGIGVLFMAVGSVIGGADWARHRPGARASCSSAARTGSPTSSRCGRRARCRSRKPKQPKLYAIVRDLTSRTGMPMPAIYLSPAAQPNAFATGRNPHHAAVAVTQGLLQVVDEDELRGVLAHELSHVANRDILITSVAAAVAMGITFVARMAMWGAMLRWVRRRRPRSRRQTSSARSR